MDRHSWMDESRSQLGSRGDAFHQYHHKRLLGWIYDTIHLHREAIGVDRFWSLDVEISCKEDMPYSEGTIAWDEHVRSATMQVRCDMTPSLTEWVVLHELIELRRWEMGEKVMKLARIAKDIGARNVIIDEYLAARNRDIEVELTLYLGHARPGHLKMDDETPRGQKTDISKMETVRLVNPLNINTDL